MVKYVLLFFFTQIIISNLTQTTFCLSAKRFIFDFHTTTDLEVMVIEVMVIEVMKLKEDENYPQKCSVITYITYSNVL